MFIATALGWGNIASVALAALLAYLWLHALVRQAQTSHPATVAARSAMAV
jgi:hypothetical protein